MSITAPNLHELPSTPEAAQWFREAILAAAASQPAGVAVYVYDETAYEGMRLFLTDNGEAGFALSGDDVVSVFRHAEAPMRKASIPMMMHLGLTQTSLGAS